MEMNKLVLIHGGLKFTWTIKSRNVRMILDA